MVPVRGKVGSSGHVRVYKRALFIQSVNQDSCLDLAIHES